MKCLVVHGFSYRDALIGNLFDTWTEDWPKFLDKPKDFGLVLFTGGEDVHPSLYNDTSPKRYCATNLSRDKIEQDIFKVALDNSIPMTGICRGSQFLNV